jgi:hypothetical protein
VKRGIQWNGWEIRVSRRVGGSMEQKMITSDRYHNDQGKERNLKKGFWKGWVGPQKKAYN